MELEQNGQQLLVDFEKLVLKILMGIVPKFAGMSVSATSLIAELITGKTSGRISSIYKFNNANLEQRKDPMEITEIA